MGTWMVLKSAGKIAPIPHWMSLRFPRQGRDKNCRHVHLSSASKELCNSHSKDCTVVVKIIQLTH